MKISNIMGKCLCCSKNAMSNFVFLLLLLSSTVLFANGTVRNPSTLSETMPAYAITDHVDLLNASSECRAEMQKFRDGVNRGTLWSLRMLDASGEPNPGFVNGNNIWLGEQRQCSYLSANTSLSYSESVIKNNSIYRNPNEEFPPFLIHYFVAHMLHNSTVQYHVNIPGDNLITLGLCLPASCRVDELSTMLRKVLNERTLFIGQLYSADFQLIDVTDLKDDHQWLLSPKILSIIFILTVVFGISFVATLYDIIVHQKRLRRKQELLTFENNNTSELKHEMEGKRNVGQEEAALSDIKPENSVSQFLLYFSMYRNVKQLFNLKNRSDGIAVIHGMRFFGMVWIVMVHTIFYGIPITANRATSVLTTDNFLMQIIANATLSVDTFFFISGFLLAHIYLKAQQQNRKLPRIQTQMVDYVLSIVKRFVRIAPAYITVILLCILNFSWHEKIMVIPFTMENINEQCTNYWWRNVLFINNLFVWDEMCLSWSWFLSCDMQFFAFGSFLLLLSSRNFFAFVITGVSALILSIVLNAYVTYSMNYTLTLAEQYEVLSTLYMQPWFRISPYLIGMATSHLVNKWNNKLHLSNKTLAICWILGIVCNCSILFGTMSKPVPLPLSIFYTAISRALWAVGVGWVVVACCTNNGGIVNKFLSLPVWISLSRLTYCVYLINPFIIISVLMMTTYPYYLEYLTTGAIFLGLLVSSFVCALPLTLMTEVPAIQFLRAVTSKRRVN